jgi:hypothetical protein
MADVLVKRTCPPEKEDNSKGPKGFALKIFNFGIHFWPMVTLFKLLKCGIRGYLICRVFNDLIDYFTKSDFKSFWDDFEIFKIILKYEDLI